MRFWFNFDTWSSAALKRTFWRRVYWGFRWTPVIYGVPRYKPEDGREEERWTAYLLHS